MKIARIGALMLWLAFFASQRAQGQEQATPQAGAATPTPSTQPAVVATPTPSDQPPAAAAPAPVRVKGSQIPHAEIRCAACHTEPALWEGEKQKLFVSPEILEHDVHWQKGVACSDCHGGDPASTKYADAHAGLVPVSQLRDRCSICHKEQKLGLIKGVHAKAGAKDDRGRGLPLDCTKCHGTNAHAILPAKDEHSPVHSANQVHTCGSCHAGDEKTYANTAHGRGLFESGLKVTAVCADCHGSHGIFYAADRRSTLHPSNVAVTCSKCHQSIEGRLEKSVHRRAEGLAAPTQKSPAGGKIKRKPACTDCHPGHPMLSPNLAEFRPPIDDSCGNCHAELYSHYSLKMHATLTDRGYTAAAKCSNCHGSHDIVPVNDPNSRVAAGENRLRTCQQCHAHAVSNFAQFDPHANFKNAASYPTLHSVWYWFGCVVNILFICYFVHAFLWFVRAFIDRLQNGGHATLVSEQYALPRFGSMQRALYAALIVAFLGLTVSGLALKYSDRSWGQWLARGLGGFRSAGILHQSFAMFAIVVFTIYVARAIAGMLRFRKERTWKSIILGPDSLVANRRDFRDFWRMLLWFIGFGRKPGFERWAYWEKLDYLVFFLVVALIGFSGMALWFPNLICLVLPGRILNVANVLHSEFALYTASVLFVIHFYHAHLRPEKFPMDLSVITGMVSEEHLRKYRPDYIARLEREGKLDELRQSPPSRRRVWLDVVAGVVVFTCGLCLLAVAILASLEE